MALTPAIFLDKDGTLLEDVPYNVDPSLMRFAPGVERGLRTLAGLRRPLLVISNQPGVALGLFRESALAAVHQRLAGMFAAAGAALSGFYFCSHHPRGHVPSLSHVCACRKPAPGLLHRAASEHGLDLAASWFVGDILDDVEAGRRAGCHTVLIDNGNETVWRKGPLRAPHHTCRRFDEAALCIVSQTTIKRSAA